MKKLLTVLLILLFCISSEVKATHYMGGEITWECTSNGNYRFIMKAYRECYSNWGSAANYGSNQILYTTVPGFASISLRRVLGWPKDIAPECNPDPNLIHIYCNNSNPMPNAAPNLGAVQEHLFTSDNAYPNGVPLTGVPPASGWMFYWGSCCRNPCANIINSQSKSWRLRAIMYPYNNQNASTCYDNSPAFAELSLSVICTGSPFTYNHNAYDVELDSLTYEWGQPLYSNGSPIVAYSYGYSWNNPLPSTVQNSNNIPAVVNSNTGEISFTSYTGGAFVTSTKVSAFKGGTKVAEIWRDMQIVLVNCGPNDKPNVAPPFQSVPNGPYDSYIDTVNAGDFVSFFIGGTDFEFLSNGSPQTVTLDATGFQFGTNYTSTTGCINPPCATLSVSPPISAQMGVGTYFTWQTSCDHLATPTGPGIYTNVYNFVIKITDDYCPIPARNISTVTIVVLSEPDLPPPLVSCISVNNDGFVELNWNPPFNFSNTFNGYHIFSSNNPNGPFMLVDSIDDYNQTTYIDSSVYVGTNNMYYYMKTSSGCHGGNNLSEPSDTITNMILSISNSGGYASLNWNSLLVSSTSTPYNKFILKRKTPTTPWVIIDSVQNTSYIDSTVFCSETVSYMVEIFDTAGCFSSSNIKTIVLNNQPIVSFQGLNSSYCSNDNIDTLFGTPQGGTFEGLGITGNIFDPSVASGHYQIKYIYTNSLACTDSSIQNVIVNPVTPVSLNLIDSVCENTGPYIFMGSPAGGNVSGPGMSGGVFHPNMIGPGTYGFNYTFVNNFGCVSNATDSLTVNPVPIINLSSLQLEYCENDPPTTMTALPLGGTYEGVGISANVFSPSIAGPGLHKIKYSYTNSHGCTNADSINVSVYPLPIVSISGLSNSYCIDNSPIYLSGIPSGGTFSGNGVSSNFFNPSIAGVGDHLVTYTFTDIHGCTNFSSQNIHVYPLPIINFSGIPSQFCLNSQAIGLTAFPFGGIYNGNGINGNSFVPFLAGVGSHNISYTYTDTNGCVNQVSSNIVVNPLPVVNFSGLNSAYCFIDTIINLTGSPMGGTFSGTGISNDGFNPKDAFPGFHSINYSYTDSNLCNNTISQTVEIYPLPIVSFVNLNSSCCLNGSIINLNGNPVGGTYSGNGVIADDFIPNIAGVGPQQLYYTFTDSLNCSNTDTGFIYVNSIPKSYAGADTSMICSSSGTFIGGPPSPGLIYHWQPTSGLSDSTSSNPFASPAISTIYTLTTTDILTNCSSTDDISIVLLNVPIADLGEDTTICYGDSIELSPSTPAATYQWNTGDTSQTIIVSPKINSSYTLTITDGICANADTIEVRINSPFVSLGNDTIICSYDSIEIDAGINHDSYLWNTGQTSQLITASSNGKIGTFSYSVTITDEYCPASDSIIVEYTKPKIDLGPDMIIYANSSVILDAGYGNSSYLWSDSSINRTLTVDSSGVGIGTKLITVFVADSLGCLNSDSINITFIKYPSNEIPSNNTIIIYPNPSDGKFIITIFGKYDELDFEVFNSLGQFISGGKIESNENYKQESLLDLSYLAKGVYSIRFENNDINKIVKIVVK